MSRLEKLASRIFPSDPSAGKIGSIEMNTWLAQVVGLPILGLKTEAYGLKVFLTLYGLVVTSLITFIYLGFEMHDLVLCWNNFDALSQNACLSLTHLAGAIKIINIIYHLPNVHNVVEKIKFAAKTYVISDKQYAAFFRGEFENKIPLTIYASLVGFTGILGMVFLFYNPDGVAGQIFPYRVKLPTWLPYEVQLAYMGLSVFVFALQIVSIDYLNVTMINQIRFQLNILNLAFDELTAEDDSVKVEMLRSNCHQYNKQLKFIVQHHCLLIELRNEVESIFRMPILLQFATSLIITAMTGFQATVKSDNSNVLIYFYCGCIFCELFVYCWFGNDVFEQSKTLATRGYSSTWYISDDPYKKSLLIFLASAQQPIVFTAGGFMGLSLPSFAGILSKSYSFIAVLRQVYGR